MHDNSTPTIGQATRALLLAQQTNDSLVAGRDGPTRAASALDILLWLIADHVEDPDMRRLAVEAYVAMAPSSDVESDLL